MASGPYLLTLEKALNAYWETGTFKMVLLNGYTENRDTHDFLDDVIASEITDGEGTYTAGGVVLTPTVTLNTTSNALTVTFPQVVIDPATIAATHAVYYKELGANTVDELSFVNNFGGTITSTSAAFTVPQATFTWDFPDTD